MADIEMVDDLFWLAFAKQHITDAISSRDDAAKALNTYLKFVWAIYTGFFAVSTSFSIIPGTVLTKLVMGLPVLIIPVACFYCIRTQLPVFESFHPDEPDSIINDLYAKIIVQKNKDLTMAKAWALIAALSIGCSIFIFRLGDITTGYSIKVSAEPYAKTIRIQAILPQARLVDMQITGYDSTGRSARLIDIQAFKTDNTGLIDTLIYNQGLMKDPIAYCSWKSDAKTLKIISSK